MLKQNWNLINVKFAVGRVLFTDSEDTILTEPKMKNTGSNVFFLDDQAEGKMNLNNRNTDNNCLIQILKKRGNNGWKAGPTTQADFIFSRASIEKSVLCILLGHHFTKDKSPAQWKMKWERRIH